MLFDSNGPFFSILEWQVVGALTICSWLFHWITKNRFLGTVAIASTATILLASALWESLEPLGMITCMVGAAVMLVWMAKRILETKIN
ncbi:hypothetical protein IC620_00265 [Hazenella sp. IB182357]|uniref:Uncharacterized protein n=1 Tax=Polycladospora coralii TaxID=2771432 RepID=A0A926N7D7_9BACL|nr:hypothetical protein [Polycladospora coralii]MBD1370793.1 hypothetical protein [Polycladospora coralii]MBS7529732.1 hypothetical protein [Polycladospora coralii]